MIFEIEEFEKLSGTNFDTRLIAIYLQKLSIEYEDHYWFWGPYGEACKEELKLRDGTVVWGQEKSIEYGSLMTVLWAKVDTETLIKTIRQMNEIKAFL